MPQVCSVSATLELSTEDFTFENVDPQGALSFSTSELVYYFKTDQVEYRMASNFVSSNPDECPIIYELLDSSDNPVSDNNSGITLQTDPSDPDETILNVYYA